MIFFPFGPSEPPILSGKMERNGDKSSPSIAASRLDDTRFIERCIAGGRADRERLARMCLPAVRKIVALGYGMRADTDDVTQTVLITLFRDLHRLRDPAAFRPWMYRIACNVIYSYGSRRSRLKSLFFVDPDMDSRPSFATATPEESTIRTQLIERLAGQLAKMKRKKRMAVVLSLFFGFVDSEIGEMMECSKEAAKKRIQTGRRELIKAVQKDPQLRSLLEEAAT